MYNANILFFLENIQYCPKLEKVQNLSLVLLINVVQQLKLVQVGPINFC